MPSSNLKKQYSLLSTLIFLLILTGCAPQEEVVIPTDTPQPPVLTILFAAEGDATALEAELLRRTGLVIDVQTVAKSTDALKALCGVNPVPVAAWLDGITFAVATAQNCGVPALQVAREAQGVETVIVPTEEAEVTDETPEAVSTAETLPGNFLTGQAGAIVVKRDLGVTELNAIVDRVFCRLGVTDFYSWLLPTLLFEAAGIDLTADNVTIVEYDDQGEMLEAVAAGDCTMAGVSQTVVDSGLPEGVHLAQTTVNFPYSVLLYPPEFDSGTSQTVNDGLLAIAADPQTAPLLTPLLDQSALLPAAPEDFTELSDFLASTGLDFEQLGE
jgi:hypothetical protein